MRVGYSQTSSFACQQRSMMKDECTRSTALASNGGRCGISCSFFIHHCDGSNDSFQTFSNIDTRMRELLGLEPVDNPNDADQQEDWRQLTGFLGLGGRRGQHGNNGNQENNAAVEGETQQQQQAANQGGNDGGTSPERRTRLSYELHLNAFF